jgi:multiple sugar transport system ATP-binding protein
MAEVRLENITKLYGKKKAVNDVSFTCKEGEFFSIFGPTGAGKSTILKMIAGIEEITAGKILFNGSVVNHLPPQERNVSMAFESYNLYPHMNVYDNIAFPLRAPRWGLKLTSMEERKKIGEIANFLGIDELLERLPQHLSGGQKQRVSLARALVRKPEVFLLDEPIAHLDARLKFSTQTLLKEYAKNYRSTIIYVTHDYREALALSDRIAVLRRGRIEQEGIPTEIYYAPVSDFVGRMIGEPPMNLLDGEIVEKDGKTCFKANDSFIIPVRDGLIPTMKRVARVENGKSLTRLGIRCEHITINRDKISNESFQLPVYAIVHETESSLVTFQLQKDTFFYARTRQEVGFRDYKVSDKIWIEFDQNNMFFFPKTIKLISKS